MKWPLQAARRFSIKEVLQMSKELCAAVLLLSREDLWTRGVSRHVAKKGSRIVSQVVIIDGSGGAIGVSGLL
jgi:hypothetical protein